MPDLEAYRRSQQPHHHEWQPLDHSPFDWCPGCGEVREHQPADCPIVDSPGG